MKWMINDYGCFVLVRWENKVYLLQKSFDLNDYIILTNLKIYTYWLYSLSFLIFLYLFTYLYLDNSI